MDQLRKYLAVAQKHHFWILSGLITILFLVTWFLSAKRMGDETKTLVSKWDASYTKANAVMQIQPHPNTQSADQMNGLIRGEAAQVEKAWGRRFQEQEDVLVWPESLLPDFIREVEPLKPIELKVKYPTEARDELPRQLRERYMNYVENELPLLARIIGSVWGGSGGGGMMGGSGMGGDMGMGMGGGPGGMGMGPGGMGMGPGGMGMGPSGMMGSGSGSGSRTTSEPIVVFWDSTNQSSLQARFSWQVAPTTVQLLYAQEDLWVLRALMLIVKATNGDADAQYNATIKQISYILMGADAGGIKDSGQTGGMGGSGSGAMGGSGEGSMGSADGMMGSAGSAGMAGMDPGMGMGSSAGGPGGSASGGRASVPMGRDPAQKRYVDDKGEPLTGDRLRTAMASDSPEDAFLAVAKRMPVRMKVRMDLRKVPLLLSKCANSYLPLEVRRVTLTPTPSGGSGAMGGGSGSMGPGGMVSGGDPGMAAGGMGGGSMMDDFFGGAGSGGMDAGGMGSGGMGPGGMPTGGMGPGGMPTGDTGSGGMGGGGGTSQSPYDGVVEIYGIIYIYNPVDPKKLGLDDEPSQAATSAAAPGGATPDASTGAGGAAETGPGSGTPAAPALTGGAAGAGTPPAADPTAGTPAGGASGSGTAPAGGPGTGAPAAAGSPGASPPGGAAPAGAGAGPGAGPTSGTN